MEERWEVACIASNSLWNWHVLLFSFWHTSTSQKYESTEVLTYRLMGKYCLWESFELHRHHNKDWAIAFCWECCTLLSLLKTYGTRARICLLAKAKDMKSNKRFSPYLGTHDNKLNLTELNKMFSQNPSLDVSSFSLV